MVGPTTVRLEGLVGEGIDMSHASLDEMAPNTVSMHLTKRLIEFYLRDGDQDRPTTCSARSSR